MDMGTSMAVCVGVITIGAGGASIVKSLCGNKTCDLHGGVLDRLKLGDESIISLNKSMGEVKEGVARVEGKLEILIKNLK